MLVCEAQVEHLTGSDPECNGLPSHYCSWLKKRVMYVFHSRVGVGSGGFGGASKEDHSPGLRFQVLTVLHPDGLKKNQGPETS